MAQAVPWRPGVQLTFLCVPCCHSRLVRSGLLRWPGGVVAARVQGRREAEQPAAGGAAVEAFSRPGAGAEFSEGEGRRKMAAAWDPWPGEAGLRGGL